MTMSEGNPIDDHVDRVEQIIETLEDGNVSLERAQELHKEGQEELEDLQDLLSLGDGSVVER
jgi:exodeoxyribonuclease VII small subunit